MKFNQVASQVLQEIWSHYSQQFPEGIQTEKVAVKLGICHFYLED